MGEWVSEWVSEWARAFVWNSTAAIETIGNRTQNSSSQRTRVLPLHHGLGELALYVMLRVAYLCRFVVLAQYDA